MKAGGQEWTTLERLRAERVNRVEDFDALHGAWWGREIRSDAKAAVRRSAERYVAALGAPRSLSTRAEVDG